MDFQMYLNDVDELVALAPVESRVVSDGFVLRRLLCSLRDGDTTKGIVVDCAADLRESVKEAGMGAEAVKLSELILFGIENERL